MKKIILPVFLLFTPFFYAQEREIEEMKKEVNKLREEVKELNDIIKNNLFSPKIIENTPPEQPKEPKDKRIKFSGRGLLRLGEWDVNQKMLNHKTGERFQAGDRFWSRFNFCLNTDVKLTENLDFHARLRTGNKQYSFVSFGGNTDERFNIILDEFWLNYSNKIADIRIGRQNASRIWNNQSGVMFDIPTHDGLSLISTIKLNNNILLQPRAALFIERYVNNKPYKHQGKIYGFSLELAQLKDNLEWKLYSGIINANNLPTRYENNLVRASDGSVLYNDGDLASDYNIWSSQLSLRLPKFHNLTLVLDYYNNLRNYKQNPISHAIIDINGNNSFSNASQFNSAQTNNFTKQKQGFITTLSVGNQSKPKSLFAGISYLYMEKYAAMDYFAQYDYARWASSNIKGTEFTLAYRLNKYLQLKSRLFITKEIKGLNAIDTDYKRSATRLRIDMNINF